MKTLIVREIDGNVSYFDVDGSFNEKNIHTWLNENSEKQLRIDPHLIVEAKVTRHLDRDKMKLLSEIEDAIGSMVLIYDEDYNVDHLDREISFRYNGRDYKLTLTKLRERKD